jgi:hypothetical protein
MGEKTGHHQTKKARETKKWDDDGDAWMLCFTDQGKWGQTNPKLANVELGELP